MAAAIIITRATLQNAKIARGRLTRSSAKGVCQDAAFGVVLPIGSAAVYRALLDSTVKAIHAGVSRVVEVREDEWGMMRI